MNHRQKIIQFLPNLWLLFCVIWISVSNITFGYNKKFIPEESKNDTLPIFRTDSASGMDTSLYFLERHKKAAIIEAMRISEIKFKNNECKLFYVCVCGKGPPERVRKSLKFEYPKIHWCSEINIEKPSKGCKAIRINVLKPDSLNIREYRFIIEGTKKLECSIPFDVGRPTTKTDCKEIK